MGAAHSVRLDLWGNIEREEHPDLQELLAELNLVFAMLFDSQIIIHLFDIRYEIVLKCREN